MFRAKLKEALICLKAGRVTLRYPGPDGGVPPAFRGRLTLDARRCIGCGGCAYVCPPRCVEIADSGPVARLVFKLERCIQCARCAEVCPEGALAPTEEFETAVVAREQLNSRMTLFMATCQRCGRCFETDSALDRLPRVRWRGAGPAERGHHTRPSWNGYGRPLVRGEGEVL